MAEKYGAFRSTGELNIPTQAAADYIADQGQLTDAEPTMRERDTTALAEKLSALGISDRRAYQQASNLLGGPGATLPFEIGVADFTPMGLVYGGQEAVRDYKEAEGGLETAGAIAGGLLSVAEAYPLTKAIARPALNFLRSLGNKKSLPPAPVDSSRREFVKKAGGSALAAGALSTLPLTKIPLPKIVPEVAKKAKLVIPRKFDFSSLNTFAKTVEDAKDIVKKEGRVDDIPLLDEYKFSDFVGDLSSDEGDILSNNMNVHHVQVIRDMIAEMKAKFPDATNKQIHDEFSKIPGDYLPPEELYDHLDELLEPDGGLLSFIESVEPGEISQIDPERYSSFFGDNSVTPMKKVFTLPEPNKPKRFTERQSN